ncbi:MAG TPA: pyridoxamine 5'-phosphate oxidase family protein [Leptolyngbyaceae cyanobacterium M33_DOE_097]|uniref:Pyridoxamine 5'-phosphate oxidase family protein n=1 Tax=Oscillatoriales cyanobacterium SpSt-418 TaxID=2282169 RepID=A0A7C3PTC7_9CYAN|nr:pyridoxamine 5'-phosphate oxidase family protein [Leptolyngbyaceae cyanobacterium M33_DOE_097]
MAKFYKSLTDELKQFISEQQMFFVATAPLSADGRVNVSPKGLDSFRVLSPNQVAYLDLTGSGNETSAHLLENGRITIMFCAFAGDACILRLYGHGTTVLPDTPEWEALFPTFNPLPGARQIILMDVEQVQTSCGFGVPLYEPVGYREKLVKWAAQKGQSGVREYQQKKNRVSIDGLPTPLGEALPPLEVEPQPTEVLPVSTAADAEVRSGTV